MDASWYALKVGSGSEDRIVDLIREGVARKGLDECLHEILVPTEEVVEVKRGVKRSSKKKLYPGYVFLKCVITDDIRHVISGLPKAVRFLGTCDCAIPIPEVEAERVVNQAREGVERPRSSVVFEIGEEVCLAESTSFPSLRGTVVEVDDEKSRLKVCVRIFGRGTIAEVDFSRVDKLSP